MDLKVQRLSQGEKIAAGSALALLVCMFLGWFNFGFAVANAWDSLHYVSPLLAIAIAATLAIATLKANGKSLGDIPDGSVIFTLGCVATALVLFRLIDPVSAGDASPFGSGGPEASGSVEAGLFLGLLAAVGIAAGGYLATGGRALDQVKTLFANGGGSAPPHSPPPPPPPLETAPSPPPQPAPPASQPTAPPLPPIPSAAVAGRAVFCEHCGAQLQESDRFCGGCGQATSSQ